MEKPLERMKKRIQMFFDSDASAMQVVLTKLELEQMGIDLGEVEMPEESALLLSFQYISLELSDEEKDKQQMKFWENKN